MAHHICTDAPAMNIPPESNKNLGIKKIKNFGKFSNLREVISEGVGCGEKVEVNVKNPRLTPG